MTVMGPIIVPNNSTMTSIGPVYGPFFLEVRLELASILPKPSQQAVAIGHQSISSFGRARARFSWFLGLP